MRIVVDLPAPLAAEEPEDLAAPTSKPRRRRPRTRRSGASDCSTRIDGVRPSRSAPDRRAASRASAEPQRRAISRCDRARPASERDLRVEHVGARRDAGAEPLARRRGALRSPRRRASAGRASAARLDVDLEQRAAAPRAHARVELVDALRDGVAPARWPSARVGARAAAVEQRPAHVDAEIPRVFHSSVRGKKRGFGRAGSHGRRARRPSVRCRPAPAWRWRAGRPARAVMPIRSRAAARAPIARARPASDRDDRRRRRSAGRRATSARSSRPGRRREPAQRDLRDARRVASPGSAARAARALRLRRQHVVGRQHARRPRALRTSPTYASVASSACSSTRTLSRAVTSAQYARVMSRRRSARRARRSAARRVLLGARGATSASTRPAV